MLKFIFKYKTKFGLSKLSLWRVHQNIYIYDDCFNIVSMGRNVLAEKPSYENAIQKLT